MLTIGEARKMQANRQMACVIKFVLSSIAFMTAFLSVYFFTDYFQRYPILYYFVVLLLGVVVFKSKIYLFFQKKEQDCTIDYCNIRIESSKKYLSNQPGVRYAANDIPILDFIATSNNGKIIHKNIMYSYTWGEFRPGDSITLLRFISQPIKSNSQ